MKLLSNLNEDLSNFKFKCTITRSVNLKHFINVGFKKCSEQKFSGMCACKIIIEHYLWQKV